MEEGQQLVSWTSRCSKDLAVMGFLKKKWLKLISKRKTKVNVVSIMSLMLIVQLGHNSIPNSVPVFVPSPFPTSSHFATVQTPLLVMVGSVEHSSGSREQWPSMLLPFSISHILARSSFPPELTPVSGEQGRGADAPP